MYIVFTQNMSDDGAEDLAKVSVPAVKRIGNRAEVFMGYSLQTAGGLKKDDIIRKGDRYISKRASEVSKLRMQERKNKVDSDKSPVETPPVVTEKKPRGRPKKALPVKNADDVDKLGSRVKTINIDS